MNLDFSSTIQARAEVAEVAVQALLDRVFLDGPAGNFDTNPALVFGCCNPVECSAIVPFAIKPGGVVLAVPATNNLPGQRAQVIKIPIGENTGSSDGRGFARFTMATATAVPEPNSVIYPLMGWWA